MHRVIVKLAVIIMCAALMLCCAAPVFATQSGESDLNIEIAARNGSIFAGDELVIELTVKNTSSEHTKISDLAFFVNYDSQNFDYSGFVNKPANVKTSASAGTVIITFSAASEAECLGAQTTWQLSFNSKTSFSSSIAQFSVDRVSACMRKSFLSTSTSTSNVSHNFIPKRPYASVGIVLSQANNNAMLADITPQVDGNTVQLVPPFAPGITSYSVTIGYDASSFSFKSVTPQDPAASVIINWPGPLEVGSTNIEIVVTAADGVTKAVYVVAVNRLSQADSNASSSTFPTVGMEQTTTTAAETTASTSEKTTTTPSESTTARSTEAETDVPQMDVSPSILTIVLGGAALVVIIAVSFFCGTIAKGASSRRAIADMQQKLKNTAAQNAILQKSVAQYSAQVRYLQQAAYSNAVQKQPETKNAEPVKHEHNHEPEEHIQYSEEGVGEYVSGAKMLYDEYGNLVEFDRYGNVIHVEYDEYGNKLS